MKIIVHMGQGKTGTTALQDSLHAAAGTLRERKVLYPDFGYSFSTHHLLVALCGDPNRLTPWVIERLGGPEGVVKAARSAWQKTCAEIRDDPPEVLVLSSEFLVQHLDGAGIARLATLLTELSNDITPVLYVRHPVESFRSIVQQFAKNHERSPVSSGQDLMRAINAIDAAFGRPTDLVAFDRKVLHGGDIVCDFATRFLAPWVDANDLQSQTANVGLSAEASALMIQLRAEAGGTYEASRRVARLVPHLAALDCSDPPAQPFTLLPEVAEAVLRSAVSHRWLAETGRLQIPGLDIDRIDGAPVPEWMKTASTLSLFQHDPERLARLRQSIEQLPPKRQTASQPTKPSENPIRRTRDLLLRFMLRKLALFQDRKTGAVPTRESSVRRSSQGDRNENSKTDGNLDAGSRDRP